MARVPNIKIGGGNVKIGHGLVHNSMKQWTGINSPLTYTDLIDRPDYYLRKVSAHFGLSYSKDFTKKDDIWAVNDPNLVRNPGLSTPPIDINKLPRIPSYKVTPDYAYMAQYTDPYYRLSFDHPDLGTLESRKLKYYFTSEEIQTVINEDLISGYSGYSVSNVGDIRAPSFGPYMLQSNRTGVNDNPIYVGTQSNASFLSGFVTGYPGDPNLHSHYTLSFFKTGSGVYNTRFEATNFEPGMEVNAESTSQDYDIDAGSYVGGVHTTYLMENSGVNSTGDAIDITLETTEPGGAISKSHSSRLLGRTSGIEFMFADDVDPDDSDKILYITGASPIVDLSVLKTESITPTNQFPLNLEVNGDGGDGYTKDNYWYLGAPSGFLSHTIFNYTGVKITNCNEIRGFRIPPQNCPSIDSTLKRIVCTDNPNLEYFRGNPMAFRAVSHFDFSGCALSTHNDLHMSHDLSFYSSTGVYPHNVFRPVPDYLRTPYYNGIEIDDAHDQAVPEGVDRSPIASWNLVHVNVASNNLNQTGAYHWIRAAQLGLRTGGYLNISDQSIRVGPEEAVFDGIRTDQHPGEIVDVNNLCISGIDSLRERNWTVIHDGSFNRL